MNVLETPRLVLREMTPSDYDSLRAVISDPVNMCHYPQPYDEKGVGRWLDWSLENYKTFGLGLWAVIRKDTGEMIGDCGITMQIIHGVFRPEIGYHLRLDCHGFGFGKEAACACRDWGFTHTPFRALYSYMTKDNVPSYSTAAAMGMTRVDAYRDGEGKDAEDLLVYRITREEWEELTGVREA